MDGAKRYADLIESGQYGKLYIVSSSHARGKTFHIFILPDGEKADPNGGGNPPLNKNAVEVYGIIGGQPGWTERYGWLYKGKWIDDFEILLKEKQSEHEVVQLRIKELKDSKQKTEGERVSDLLAQY